MADIQTVPTKASVSKFLATVTDKQKRADSEALVRMMREASGERPVMWGPAIVGFGSLHYKYASGREGDMPIVGFSPRKQSLTLYIDRTSDKCNELLTQLGKHKTSKACLYIKRLDDIHLPTLRRLLRESVRAARRVASSARK